MKGSGLAELMIFVMTILCDQRSITLDPFTPKLKYVLTQLKIVFFIAP